MKTNRRQKGDLTYTHDLFKLKTAVSKHNVSYRKFEPILEDVEHTHFFHSHDRAGNPQKYCTIGAGHFHEVVVTTDARGDLVAKCGPAVRWDDVKSMSGKVKKQINTISWIHEAKDMKIEDNHTHETFYMHSEEVSENKVIQQARQDAEKLERLSKKKPALSAQVTE